MGNELLLRGLHQMARLEDPGIVHKDVELAECVDGELHRRSPLRLVGDIVPHGAGIRAQFAGHIVHLGQHIGEDDLRALRHEGPRLVRSLPARRAGDERYLAVQYACHHLSPKARFAPVSALLSGKHRSMVSFVNLWN